MIKQDGLKEKYDFSCPHCNKEGQAAPSIFMGMGMNLGKGDCTECKKPFLLEINQDNTAMIAKKMD